MDEWWTYAPSDFLLYSRTIYERQFALMNQALWPAQALVMGVAAAAMLLQASRSRWALSASGLLQAALWGSVAWLYFLERHAQINFIAPVMAVGFALQAVLLAAYAVLSPFRLAGARPLGSAMAALALFAVPLLPLFQQRAFMEAEIVGFAPDPTAAFTLGLLAAAQRPPILLALVPLAWLGFSALALWTMGSPSWGAVLAFALVAAVALRPRVQRSR